MNRIDRRPNTTAGWTDPVRPSLRPFGLSNTEIDVYVEILDHGETTVDAVVDDTALPSQYVHAVVDTLATNGLVVVDDGPVPRGVRAISPTRLVDRFVEHMPVIGTELRRLFGDDSPSGTFDVLARDHIALSRLRSLVKTADEELCLLLPTAVVEDLRPSLRAARARGVTVVLVESVPGDAAPTATADVDGIATVHRHCPEHCPVAVAADWTVGIVAMSELFDVSHDDGWAVQVTRQRTTESLFDALIGAYWPVEAQARPDTTTLGGDQP